MSFLQRYVPVYPSRNEPVSQSELGPVARLTESKPFGLAMFAASLGLAVKLAAIPDLQAALSTYRSPHAEKAILVVPHLPPYRRCASSLACSPHQRRSLPATHPALRGCGGAARLPHRRQFCVVHQPSRAPPRRNPGGTLTLTLTRRALRRLRHRQRLVVRSPRALAFLLRARARRHAPARLVVCRAAPC